MAFFKDRANALASAWAINSLAYSIIYPFIPIYLHEERNLPMDQVGMIFPLMGLAIIVTPPFSGVLAGRIGRRFLMQFGQTSRAGMFLLLAALAYWNAPFWIFAVGLMINAGIGTFFQVGADAYLADISTPEERTHAYSKIRIGTNIGWAVGPMLGAFLARTPFALMFVMTALLCIFGARYTGWCCPTEPARNAAARAAEAEHHISFRTVAADHRLTRILGCSFLLFLLTSQLYSVMSVYGTSVVGISRDALGLIYSLNGFAIITCQMPVTRLLDRFGLLPLRRLVMGAAFYAFGYFTLGFAGNAWMMAVSVFILTIGEAVVQPALYTQISCYAPAGGTGRYMAALELVRGVGYAVGPYLGSVIFQHCSDRPLLMWTLLALLGVGAGTGFRLLGIGRSGTKFRTE